MVSLMEPHVDPFLETFWNARLVVITDLKTEDNSMNGVSLGVVLQSFNGLNDHLGDWRKLLFGSGLLLGRLVVYFLLLLALALLLLGV